ncbi:phosphoglycerate mutase [Dictyobacter vulcani]|uniref:Phosphoglycerate mutase n=1 Tax=Dictyobacter vulcani TaxID=2607529 RepID=A0A5J4KKV5_9CHLR|nr:histidine phosphatase family protein [Dictyobacter vulcani]GER86831.1 phosphoglycerate mutase [Dictyobacter vulcani]
MKQLQAYIYQWLVNIYRWLYLGWFYVEVGLRFIYWRMRLSLFPESIESTQTHMKQTLLIVRHGQTTWNVQHRLPGQLSGVALNEIGHQQAARLGEALQVFPISTIISSPLERAYHTAEYLVQGRNIEIMKEPDLMDTNVGPWAGQVIQELSKNDPNWQAYVKDPTTAPEGIETFPQVQQRVVAAVERWLAREDIGAYPTFVAHADVVKLLLAHYARLQPAQAGVLSIDNASVSLVELSRDKQQDVHPHVIAIGWSPQPSWLKSPAPEKPAPTDAQEAGEQKM